VASKNKSAHLYSHTGDDLHSCVSEVMAMCAVRSFRSTARSSLRSLDLVRAVSRVSLASTSGRGEVVSLERECWSGGGGFAVLL
jgi:hypothetical protein